jgi:hypothetical protein
VIDVWGGWRFIIEKIPPFFGVSAVELLELIVVNGDGSAASQILCHR